MKSINEQAGTTINELEATLILVEKLLQRQIDAGGKGIIISKGNTNEVKLTYKKALKVIHSIDKSFSYKGCKSYGICQTCKKFDSRGFTDGEFGYCGSEMKHKYDTCQNHSHTGGGFGL